MPQSYVADAPASGGLRGRIVTIRSIVQAVPFSLIRPSMRISIGLVFFNSGLLKLRCFDFAVKLFEDEYKLPLLPLELVSRGFSACRWIRNELVRLGAPASEIAFVQEYRKSEAKQRLFGDVRACRV